MKAVAIAVRVRLNGIRCTSFIKELVWVFDSIWRKNKSHSFMQVVLYEISAIVEVLKSVTQEGFNRGDMIYRRWIKC